MVELNLTAEVEATMRRIVEPLLQKIEEHEKRIDELQARVASLEHDAGDRRMARVGKIHDGLEGERHPTDGTTRRLDDAESCS